MHQLKKSGFVNSKRGYQGGYYLVPKPDELSVGDIIRFLEPSGDAMDCIACVSKENCPFESDCALSPLWEKVAESLFCVYDGTSMKDLVDAEKEKSKALSSAL